MIPMLRDHPGNVVAHIDVVDERRFPGAVIRPNRGSIAAVDKFVSVALAAEGTRDTHGGLMQIRMSPLALLVDEMASGETV
jgi:hypothetical protein